MNIEVFGAGDRTRVASSILRKADELSGFGIENIKLFGIPTSRDGIHVTGSEIKLASVLSSAKRGDYVIGYALGEGNRALLDARSIRYYDGSLDEEFLLENAYITAIGTLSYLFGAVPRVPRDLKIGIIGYGRIGKALLRMLLFFESSLTVFTTRQAVRVELGKYEVESALMNIGDDELNKKISSLDILINTAPCQLSGLFPDGEVPEELRVLDLASGDSFRAVRGVERLPSLPDRMYPVSAGVSYAKYAVKHITG